MHKKTNFELKTVHCALCTVYSIQSTVHCTLYTVYCRLGKIIWIFGKSNGLRMDFTYCLLLLLQLYWINPSAKIHAVLYTLRVPGTEDWRHGIIQGTVPGAYWLSSTVGPTYLPRGTGTGTLTSTYELPCLTYCTVPGILQVYSLETGFITTFCATWPLDNHIYYNIIWRTSNWSEFSDVSFHVYV